MMACLHCGKVVQQKPSLIATFRFCSQACKNAHKTATGIKTLACAVCGRQFTRRASRLGEFCSYACLGASKHKRVTVTCAVCGKQFVDIECHAAGRLTCSRKCIAEIKGQVIEKAMRNRKRTKPENAVHQALSDAGIANNPQYPIGPFLVDFFLPHCNTVLEVDGVYWHSLPTNKARDRSKNAYLSKCGYRVVRVTDIEVNTASDLPAFILERLQIS